jgi:hypothetical protein
MKVLTFSRHFPKGHPRQGHPTWFVEKVEACLADTIPGWEMSKTFTMHEWDAYYNCSMPKSHTIRGGNRFKVGDMASLRVWSDKPYRSKQIEFAQVEVKKVWQFVLRPVKENGEIFIKGFLNGTLIETQLAETIALNDGLTLSDFQDWFCPNGTKFILSLPIFTGQIICWSDKITY